MIFCLNVSYSATTQIEEVEVTAEIVTFEGGTNESVDEAEVVTAIVVTDSVDDNG